MKIQNMDRVQSILSTGLQGHQREAGIDRFQSVAESLVKSFEQSTRLSIDDEGVDINKVKLDISSPDEPENNVSIAYSRRHTGLFPFPHDHCVLELCWETTTPEGETVEMCIEIEYPCNVDWPIIGRL